MSKSLKKKTLVQSLDIVACDFKSSKQNGVLVADVFLLLIATKVALYVTAPDETAVAFLLHLFDTCLVAAAATKQSAAI